MMSVVSAFCFVVMMFNLPLPGGTTGHAVGMGMAAIILGPWTAIVALSVALLVQALLFGDGGITAYGANCFNMAIVGSLVSLTTYRLIAYRAALTGRRRVIGAGIGGYVGINVAALCAAIEFGIQPLLFHDASGTPLYAPYPLRVAIPAMMIGHLTFAGIAEFVLSAGMVAYVQRFEPELLRRTATEAPSEPGKVPTNSADWRLPASRKVWIVLALFLVLTPLGILAGGSAWGEWRAASYRDPSQRQQIASASGNHAAPTEPPVGLARLARLWQAPLTDYAPTFIRSAPFGYLVSAAVGVGAIILVGVGVSAVSRKRAAPFRRITFVEKSMRRFGRVMDESLFAEELASAKGLLQRMDPRVKLIGLAALILASIAVHKLAAVIAVFAFALVLARLSRLTFRMLGARVWAGVFLFTGLIALPALFLTPGQALASLPILRWPITEQGLRAAALLILRAESAATVGFLLVASTPWAQLLRSLRWFRMPVSVVAVLEISYRYIFVLLQTAENLFEARQTRWIGNLAPMEQRNFASSTAVVLLDKSFQLSGEIHLAMQARGFRGSVVLLDDLQMTASNWAQAVVLLGVSAAIVLWGR